MRRKRLWLAALLLLVLVLALPLLVSLEIFRAPVHRALEQQLGRRVEFAALTARLVPRPGLVARGVLVHEEAGFGHEPFLYAEEAHCNLSPGSLLRGRLNCAELYFVRPSINLVRREDGQWNVAELLREAAPAGAPLPPAVSVGEGRINFKLGPDKQWLALSDVRVRLEPEPLGRWRLALTGRPWRVDRRLNETGELGLTGELLPGAAGTSPGFRIDAGLDSGSVSQWWVLFAGTELPLRAQASAQARFEGTLADWTAHGQLVVEDVRRWDLVAPSRSPRWEMAVRARRAAREDFLVLEEATVRTERSEIGISGQLENLRGEARWTFEVNSERLALDDLGVFLAAVKPNVVPGLRWEGEAQLALVAAGPVADWKGTLAAPAGARVHVPGISEPVQLAELRLRLQKGVLTLDPAVLQFSPQHKLSLGGEARLLEPGLPYRLRWQSAQVELEPLWRAAEAVGWEPFGPARWRGRARVDVEWRGRLREESPTPWPDSGWRGTVQLTEASYFSVELNAPLEIPLARVAWSGSAVQVQPLELRLGESRLNGSLQRLSPARPWEVSLTGARLRLAEVNALVNPAQRGLFERLVRSESRVQPGWSQGIAVGKVRLQEFEAGPFRLIAVEADGDWRAGVLSLQRLRFRAYAGRFDGRLQADFRDATPRYRLAGNVRQMSIAGVLASATRLGGLYTGLVSAELALDTAGTRPRDLRRNLQGRLVGGINHGALTHVDLLAAMAAAAGEAGRSPASGGATTMQSLVGEFRVAEERVELQSVHLLVDEAALVLSGGVGFDGRMDLEVRGEPMRLAGREVASASSRLLSGVYRFSGTLAEPQVEVVEAPRAAGAR